MASAAGRIERVAALQYVDNRRETLRRVFDKTHEALYRFILFRVGGDRDVADDLLQQTCYEAARHRRPPVESGECEAWLRGIARNLIRRHWRRSKRHAGVVSLENAALATQLADDLEARPLPSDALVKEESITQLLLAVTSLSAADQGLIFAFYFDGRGQADIARKMGATEKSVESRLFRARARLRAALRNAERPGGP
jgi:RNA polymerase sigma-70 factor (ECF subfamily)